MRLVLAAVLAALALAAVAASPAVAAPEVPGKTCERLRSVGIETRLCPVMQWLCFYGATPEHRRCGDSEADTSFRCWWEGGTWEEDSTCTPGTPEPNHFCDENGCWHVDYMCEYEEGSEFCTKEERDVAGWCWEAGGSWTEQRRCRRPR